MNLLGTISTALAPVLQGLAGQFGTTVAVFRRTAARADDGSTIMTRDVDNTGTEVRCFLRPVSDALRLRVFGSRSEAMYALTVPRLPSGALPMFLAGDAVRVTSGPYSGVRLVCETAGTVDAGGVAEMVPLVSAPPGASW